MVVSGSVGDAQLDEFSTLGQNFVAEFYQERGFATSMLGLDEFPLQKASLEDLRGGDARTNAEIIRRLLRGEDKGPKRDAVLLNAAAALFVAGQAKSLAAGWEFAADLIDSGRAFAKMQELVSASQAE
jgi:anthranilate phosphoribosyltransferase